LALSLELGAWTLALGLRLRLRSCELVFTFSVNAYPRFSMRHFSFDASFSIFSEIKFLSLTWLVPPWMALDAKPPSLKDGCKIEISHSGAVLEKGHRCGQFE
jgi:hypothetical protein